MTEPSFKLPIVMLAGSSDARFEAEVPRFRKLLLEAFTGFTGTLISGGTEQGVAGIAGAIAARYPAIHTVGYVPAVLAAGATNDARYTEIRRTAGARFTAAEPLQAWVDILAAGIEPGAVTVLGIGGGDIAAQEYRVSLALGARVGLVEDSGPAVDALLADPRSREGVEPLPASAAAITAFLGGAPTG
jgi:hypothetical protein